MATLSCGIGQADSVCGRPAVGALIVQTQIGDADPQEGRVLVCPAHLGPFGPVEAVFDADQPQPQYPSSHHPDVTLSGAPRP